MKSQKTTFQNWIDINYPLGTRKNLAKKVGVAEFQLTRDYNNPNGLKMIEKYLKKIKKKSVDLQGWEYGMYIELKNVKIV